MPRESHKTNSVIPPLLLALRVDIDNAIGFKSLLIELSKLGCISCDEVKRYKLSLMRMSESTLSTCVITGFIQLVADDVGDHVELSL